MSATVIAHFYNEELLLPFWLKHHTRLFSHGVMIDYASTDRSLDIIRNMAPTWEIRSSRNVMFDSAQIDSEVAEIETEVHGWKMALNITEFLLCSDLHAYLHNFEAMFPQMAGVRCSGVVQVDRPEEQFLPLTDAPLWEQSTFGYREIDRLGTIDPPACRCRLLHKAAHGHYGPGRHITSLPYHFDPDLFLFWVGWGLIEHKKQRNNNTRQRIPAADLQKGWGHHHVWSDQQLEDFWRSEIAASHNLMEIPEYRAAIKRMDAISTHSDALP